MDLRNVMTLMYYRFARDFSYANFGFISQKVNFHVLFILRLPEYVLVLLRLWSGTGLYTNSNLLFLSREC